MEDYDHAGKLSKRFEVVSAQKIEGRWYLKQMRVEAIDPSIGLDFMGAFTSASLM